MRHSALSLCLLSSCLMVISAVPLIQYGDVLDAPHHIQQQAELRPAPQKV